MANILEAAKWLQQGKTVRRAINQEPIYGPNYRIRQALGVTLDENGLLIGVGLEGLSVPFALMHINALLADNWEVVEETV